MHIYLCKRFDNQGHLEEKVFRIANSNEEVNNWLKEREIEGYWIIQLCEQDKKDEEL